PVLAVVHDGIVQAAVARPGVEGGVRQVVHVHEIHDHVRGPAVLRRAHRVLRGAGLGLDAGPGVLLLHVAVIPQAARSATHFSGSSWMKMGLPTGVRSDGCWRDSSVRSPSFTWKSSTSPRNTFWSTMPSRTLVAACGRASVSSTSSGRTEISTLSSGRK